MTHFRIAALLVVVVGIASTGCTWILGETSPKAEAPDRTVASKAPSGTARPPGGVLILGAHAVSGVLGSYCWEAASGPAERLSKCTDVASIPVPPGDEALTVPRDWVVVFDYGGRGWLGSVDAGAYPLDRGKGSLSGGHLCGDLERTERRSALGEKDLRVSRLGERVQIPIKLAAGEYVIEVSVRVPAGDVAYYFRVVVV